MAWRLKLRPEWTDLGEIRDESRFVVFASVVKTVEFTPNSKLLA